ncbi:X-linked retinitis pigmentosa GTPase regulator-like isoform X2 [Zootermopsis nevadensis]|uniref:X-linked retinitis pigmentosa GTPase regulator-like isoform X2 n=1 Tax=Zootermopsis nevadensis TaxID=136037 RepID=UPI000B8EA047|nr:X-linked retinitis pigmentosa GTPase regulator-like isoform X2 [Zootermopsis nevadensis]
MLREKLQSIFPSLHGCNFIVAWKDAEGDKITMSSDEELMLALTESQTEVRKLYLKPGAGSAEGEEEPPHVNDNSAGPSSSKQQKSQEQQEDAHIQYLRIIGQLVEKGRVSVFGNNDYGQLGLGHKNVTVKPSCVKSLKPEKATHVACGRAHTLLSTDSGEIFSWGSNSDGQLGVVDVADRSAPTRVLGVRDEMIRLSAGCISSAALTACGHVYVWGSNSGGQLGLPETNDSVLSPVLMPFDQQIVHISFGYYHTAFVTVISVLGDL